MRVIAGSLKGRTLDAPTWDGLRPTSDKLRETLFNVLAPRIQGARVLDGYAGTGAVGIEALSRGAAHVTFVERDRRAAALIASNLQKCGISDGYVIIQTSVLQAIDRLRNDSAFDVILLDPPYASDFHEALPHVGDIVKPDGVVILEHARRSSAPPAEGRLVRVRELRSGDSVLTFYSCQP
ncbi:MAG TPA: 16S rRNA (guanine(966)-N(2))-methyltransferase RsmD [Vicinamibacterales bacterium]|nr:16S rRNA (guanine(966)-N(2))-methyltransferase RsmD [Vicinamibacterales bacterium]